VIRLTGGVFFLIGALMMAYNFYRTIRGDTLVVATSTLPLGGHSKLAPAGD
jgi:cbb3-type cytochrome oxidase subunit 1